MRRWIKQITCLTIFWGWALFIGVSHASGEAATYRLLQDPWAPWTEGEFGPAKGGVAVDIAKAIFGRMGAGVDVHLHPWNRVRKMLEFGQGDGFLMVVKDPDMAEFIAYSVPYITSKTSVFFHQNRFNPAFNWSKYSDFKGLTIGLVSGYSYGRFSLSVRRLGLNAEYARTPAVNIGRLVAGRIDILIGDEEATQAIVRQHPAWQDIVVAAEKPLFIREYRLGIARSSPLFHRIDEINAAIESLKQDGTIQRLRK